MERIRQKMLDETYAFLSFSSKYYSPLTNPFFSFPHSYTAHRSRSRTMPVDNETSKSSERRSKSPSCRSERPSVKRWTSDLKASSEVRPRNTLVSNPKKKLTFLFGWGQTERKDDSTLQATGGDDDFDVKVEDAIARPAKAARGGAAGSSRGGRGDNKVCDLSVLSVHVFFGLSDPPCFSF